MIKDVGSQHMFMKMNPMNGFDDIMTPGQEEERWATTHHKPD